MFSFPFLVEDPKNIKKIEKGDARFPISPTDRVLKGKFWFFAPDRFG